MRLMICAQEEKLSLIKHLRYLENSPGARFLWEVILEDESRLQRLQEWAKEHKKEVVVTSTLATGATVALVGAAWMLKHYLERKEEK